MSKIKTTIETSKMRVPFSHQKVLFSPVRWMPPPPTVCQYTISFVVSVIHLMGQPRIRSPYSPREKLSQPSTRLPPDSILSKGMCICSKPSRSEFNSNTYGICLYILLTPSYGAIRVILRENTQAQVDFKTGQLGNNSLFYFQQTNSLSRRPQHPGNLMYSHCSAMTNFEATVLDLPLTQKTKKPNHRRPNPRCIH